MSQWSPTGTLNYDLNYRDIPGTGSPSKRDLFPKESDSLSQAEEDEEEEKKLNKRERDR